MRMPKPVADTLLRIKPGVGKHHNVQEIVDASLCMGCGVCEPVCPPKCIRIGESPKNKQLIPIVDHETCIAGCDVCLRVCPGGDVDFDHLNRQYLGSVADRTDIGLVDQVVIGHAADRELRYEASSGGAVTAFLVYLLENDYIDGAIVVRMKRDAPHATEVVVARNRAELLESKGSKYCPAASCVGIESVMRQPGRYAFVGLSCHVHGARKFQEVFKKYRDRIVITLGLFCGGGITGQGTEFVLSQMGVDQSDLDQLTIRGEGWPGKTVAIRKDGTRAELYKRAAARTTKEAAVYTSWMHRYFFPPRCLTCTDVTAQLADVSFGDPWLKRCMEIGEGGLSMIVTRSPVGTRLLQLAIRDGAITVVDDATPQEIADSQRKLARKTNTSPYRMAARLLGMKTPDYGDLYNEGRAGPLAIAVALWEYVRLHLGRYPILWRHLLRLELFSQRFAKLRGRWRGKMRRLPGKLLQLAKTLLENSKSQEEPAVSQEK